MRRVHRLLLLPRHSRRPEAHRKCLPYLLTERNRDGELVLRRRLDGACIHLGEQGCTIYEQAVLAHPCRAC
jgi:hypothetical protein